VGIRERIRETGESDLTDVLHIHASAFGQQEEAELVSALLADPSAQPALSLIALTDAGPVGHILFSAARLTESEIPYPFLIMAPLAVVPEAQGRGIGGELIATAVRHLTKAGVALVFVLGYPQYYSRHQFEPAAKFGLAAPYPIAPEHTDAWMVRALRPGVLGSVRGTVMCADALNKPEYWCE